MASHTVGHLEIIQCWWNIVLHFVSILYMHLKLPTTKSTYEAKPCMSMSLCCYKVCVWYAQLHNIVHVHLCYMYKKARIQMFDKHKNRLWYMQAQQRGNNQEKLASTKEKNLIAWNNSPVHRMSDKQTGPLHQNMQCTVCYIYLLTSIITCGHSSFLLQ